MIVNVTGRITNIEPGKDIPSSNGQGTVPMIRFSISASRGNTKKRKSLLNGKEYDCDYYRVTVFGTSALSFSKYASVGRTVQLSGRLLQEEYITKNKTVQITPDHPLYGYFSQLIGQVPPEVLAPGVDDKGNPCLYTKANYVVNKANMTCIEYHWTEANPNNQNNYNNGGFQNFQPQNQGFGQNYGNANQGFMQNSGFGQTQPQPQAQGFGAQQTGFGAQPQTGFGAQTQAQPQLQGFGVQAGFTNSQAQPQAQQTGFGIPQTQGFGQPQTQVQGFGAQPSVPQNNAMSGFSGQVNPTQAPEYAGFGAPSAQPQGFGATPVNQGFTPSTSAQAIPQNQVNTNINANANAQVNNGFVPSQLNGEGFGAPVDETKTESNPTVVANNAENNTVNTDNTAKTTEPTTK